MRAEVVHLQYYVFLGVVIGGMVIVEAFGNAIIGDNESGIIQMT